MLKQREAPEASPIDLALQLANLSVVVVAGNGDTADELPGAVFTTLQALRDVDVPGGVSAATWAKAADGASERTFYRPRSGLLRHGLIVDVGTDRQPKYRPADALEGVHDALH